jgi:hypothetical protein
MAMEEVLEGTHTHVHMPSKIAHLQGAGIVRGDVIGQRRHQLLLPRIGRLFLWGRLFL